MFSSGAEREVVDIHPIRCACFESAVAQRLPKEVPVLLPSVNSADAQTAGSNPVIRDNVLMVDHKIAFRSLVPRL